MCVCEDEEEGQGREDSEIGCIELRSMFMGTKSAADEDEIEDVEEGEGGYDAKVGDVVIEGFVDDGNEEAEEEEREENGDCSDFSLVFFHHCCIFARSSCLLRERSSTAFLVDGACLWPSLSSTRESHAMHKHSAAS